MNHYFIENPALLTHERELFLEIFGHKFRFLTNNGLFSCDKVDEVSLTMLKNMPPIEGTLLDLGCGWGLLGIVLAKTYQLELTQADINSLALAYAERNAAKNGIRTTAIHSDCFDAIPGKFDNIVLNPPIHAGKAVTYRMYEEAPLHLNLGGSLFIVIQKKHGAESTLKKLQEIFSYCEVIHRKKGCFVIRCATKKSLV